MEEEQKEKYAADNKGMGKGLYIGVAVVFILLLLGYFAFKSKFMSGSNSLTPVSGGTTSDFPTSAQNPEVTGQMSTTTALASVKLVEVTSSGFQPSVLTIKVGDEVTWENKSGGNISINSDLHPTHLLYPPLNLGIVADGGSASLVFPAPGSYGYHNHLNPSQTGTIVVQ